LFHLSCLRARAARGSANTTAARRGGRGAQEVQRLYRASLRLLDSWAIDRHVFLDEAEKIRNQFDK
jgi:hypothetical protein